ncbi:MAG: histidine phosphatase family protein [Ignavibacteriales bacterium]|nr:histidine phosphatase family protein [Ignavibacteriales bacterium]
MKLGLVRHFKVITNEKPFLSSKEFTQAMANYDVAKVRANGLKINAADWEICYCSTLPRAITTAETIYNKEIIKTELLVEVPISPFTNWNIKLPLSLWHIGARIAWYKSHKSQLENIHQTKHRINEFYKLIKNFGYENILIVSHGYFLRMFYEEMKKKGFTGEVDLNIQNGRLYLIED